MKLPWERGEDKKEEKKEDDDIELKAKDVKAKLDSIDTLKTTVDGFGEKLKSLDTVTAYITAQQRKEEEAAKKKNADAKKEQEDEEEENLDFLGDPLNATKQLINKSLKKATDPLLIMTVNTQSKQLAKEHFGENPKFALYTDPTFKAEVDRLIMSLPLNARIEPASLENCYAVVAFNKAEEIKEGKIKARFAAAAGAASGTGQENDTKKEMVLNADQKKAAAMFGLSEKEYGERFQKEHSIV